MSSNIATIAESHQTLPHPAWVRMFLMYHQQDVLLFHIRKYLLSRSHKIHFHYTVTISLTEGSVVKTASQ